MYLEFNKTSNPTSGASATLEGLGREYGPPITAEGFIGDPNTKGADLSIWELVPNEDSVLESMLQAQGHGSNNAAKIESCGMVPCFLVLSQKSSFTWFLVPFS